MGTPNPNFGAMNMIKAQAEEIVLKELVYD